MSLLTAHSRLIALLGESGSLRGRLIRGGAGSAIIQALNRLIALVVGIALARGLGAEGYGVYAYAFALMSVLMVPAELGMPVLLVREVAASVAKLDWAYVRGICIRSTQIVLAASTTISLIAAFLVWQFGESIPSDQRQTLLLVLLLLPLSVLSKAFASALHGLQHVVIGQAVEALLRPTLVLLGVLVLFAAAPVMRLPQYAMAVQVVVAVAVLFISLLLLIRYLPNAARTTKARHRTREWLANAIPFTLIGGAGIINNQVDILMLGYFRPPEDVGIYRVAVQGSVLVAFGLQAMTAVVAPQFARLYAQGDMARLQRLITISARVVFITALPVVLIFVLAGGTIAGRVFGPEFVASHYPLAILAVGQLVNTMFGPVGALLQMVGYENITARMIIITALLNIPLNALLILFYGATGAAMATAICVGLLHLLLFFIARKRLGLRALPI